MTHLSLDELGDVETAQHDPHVMACTQCRQVVDEQRAVRTLLSGLPAPAAAPPDVVASIQAALRAEAAARIADTGSAGSGATIIPLDGASSRRAGRRPARYLHRGRGPQLLAAAAAAVVVVGGGALVSQQLTSVGSSGSDAAAGASGEMATRSGGGGAEDAAAAALLATGTAYTQGGLSGQVSALLARATSGTAGGKAASGPMSRPGALDGCLQALGATTTPLAVDVATYERRPAAVVVLPAAGGGREVWVVEPTCRVGADGTLYYARLP